MKEIALTRGFAALVDDEDVDWIARWKWHFHPSRSKFYAARNSLDAGVKRLVLMHRQIVGAMPGTEIDHWNGDGLDNQRGNLRDATRSQQSMNQAVQRRSKTSRFKGVSWHKRAQRWRSYIVTGGRHVSLGFFDAEEEAAMAYNSAALQRFGEFARLNVMWP